MADIRKFDVTNLFGFAGRDKGMGLHGFHYPGTWKKTGTASPADEDGVLRGKTRAELTDASSRDLGRCSGPGRRNRTIRPFDSARVEVFTPYGATESLPVAKDRQPGITL